MHIFNTLTACMQGLKKIHWKLWEELITQNSIPYNAKICQKWLSSKGRNYVKINSRSNKNPHAHLQYVQNMYAKSAKDPLKTVGGVDYTKLYTLQYENLPKMTKFKRP